MLCTTVGRTDLVVDSVLVAVNEVAPQAHSGASSILDVVVANNRPVSPAVDAYVQPQVDGIFSSIRRCREENN